MTGPTNENNAKVVGSDAFNKTMFAANKLLVGNTPPASIAITNAAGAATKLSAISFQVNDQFGNAVTTPQPLFVFLSDSSSGVGYTAGTTPSTFAVLSSLGVIFDTMVSGKAALVQTNASGVFRLSIKSTSTLGFYPSAYLMNTPNTLAIGAQLTSSSYHP
jgi:hypothetical protein